MMLCCFAMLQSQAQIKQAKLQASGLTCSMCSKSIYKALQNLPFADNIQSNIKESTFTIDIKEGMAFEVDEIKKAVEDAGFSVANLQLQVNFNNASVMNDTHLEVGGLTFHFLDIKQQTLSGQKTIKVVDKDFVTDKVYKKYAATTKMTCVKTGIMESCCKKDKEAKAGTRIYHVTI